MLALARADLGLLEADRYDAVTIAALADRSGRTPLQLATARGYGEMVGMLQQRGAR